MYSPPVNECYSPPLKRCSTCRQDLPLVAYQANRANKDGLQRVCRECRRKAYNPNRVLTPPKYKLKRPRRRHVSLRTGPRRLRLPKSVRTRNNFGDLTPLGQHIAEYLLSTHLSQAEIAWRVDVPGKVVSKIWTGMRKEFPELPQRVYYQNHIHERANGGVHLRHRDRRKMSMILPPRDPKHAEIYAWLRGKHT
jgi:hypothetical protein